MPPPRIRRRERDVIIQALRAGVVPRLGLRHIQVGRAREIEEMLRDIRRIEDGGSSIRFVIGEFGSGKTFFLNLVRLVALEKGLVAMSADLAPDRRLYATGGQARSLFAEMARNLSTRTKPDGGALPSVVERFVSRAAQAAGPGGDVDSVIRSKLAHFEEYVGGYDFATVVGRYWEGHETGNERLKSDVLRWLRAEFATRTDSRKALGVRTIVTDASVYDHLKLYSAFVREAGYKGLLVVLDEMVNLYKLVNSRARNSNFEQILRILNDVLQGSASYLGFVMGGTPEFLMDTRRGLYSYPALQSRLAENTFCPGRPHRPFRPSDRLAEPVSRGPLRTPRQDQGGLCRRTDRLCAGPPGGVESVHGPLLQADRRRLLPNAQKHRESVCQPALRG